MTIGTPVHRGAGTGSTSGTTGSFTPSANSTLLCWLGSRLSTGFDTVNAPTDSLGGTWTEVNSGVNYSGPNSNARLRYKLYKQRIGGSPASMTVSGSVAGASEGFHMIVEEVPCDADLDITITVATASNSAGDPSTTISGSPAAAISFMAGQGAAALTEPSGYTEIYDATGGTSSIRVGCAYDLSSPGTTTAWTSTNTNSVVASLELKELSDSVGSASGTGAASGVGEATTNAPGSASGAGAASGVGASIAEAVGSASGSGAATGVAQDGSVGAAGGTGAASGIGASIASAVGSAGGAGAASGVGSGTTSAVGAASGQGDAAAIGAAVGSGVGSAGGSGAATGIGAATAFGDGIAAGTGEASGVGNATGVQEGVGSAAGVGAAIGVSNFVIRRRTHIRRGYSAPPSTRIGTAPRAVRRN